MKKIEKAGEKIKTAGKGLSAAFIAPVVGVTTAGSKYFSDLSSAQSQVQATFGLTKKEAANLNQLIENVFTSGMVTSIDESKTAVMELANQFPELRNASAESIIDMTKKILAIETTLGSDMTETMRGVNCLMEQYCLSGEEAMDLIAKTGQNGLDKTNELGDNLAEYVTNFKDAGYSAEDIFAILETGLDSGAYNLDKVNDLVKEFGNHLVGGDVQTAVENLGGNFVNLYKQIQDGNLSSKDAFQLLAGEINKLSSDQEKATAIAAIFGSQREDAGIKVVESIEKASDALLENKQAYEYATGAAKEMTNGVEESVTYQSAINELLSAAGVVGEQLAPTILGVAKAVKEAAQWFKGLDENTQNTIMTIAGIAAVVGPLLVVLGSVAGSITKIATAASGFLCVWTKVAGFLGLSGGAFALVVAGIALMIGGLILAYNKVEWFRNGVNAFFQGVSDVAVELFNFLGGYFGNVFGGIIQNFQNFFDAGKRIFTGFIDFITGAFTGDWELAWKGVANIFGGILDGIAAMAKAPINGMIGLINGFLGGLNNIKIPKWVPGFGGKSFSISTLPYLANGGHVLNGQAIVGEAGPELLTNKNGKTTVTPLSDEEKRKGIGGKVQPAKVEQHIHIGNDDANNPSELNKMNRKF